MPACTALKVCSTFPLHRLCLTVAAVIASLGLTHAALAAPPAMRYVAEPQLVTIGEERALFCASVLVCGAQADGFVTLQSSNGEVLDLLAAATADLDGSSPETSTVPLILLPPLDEPARPGDFVRATVSPIADDPACDLWDYSGSTVEGGPATTRLTFVAEGGWFTSRDRCQPLDFGQLDVRAYLESPRQLVKPFDGSDPFEFEALVCIDDDLTAVGLIDAPLSSAGSLYGAFAGAVLPAEETGVVLVIFATLPNAGSTDDLMIASGVLNGTVNPDCMIWDLVNGTSGQTTNAATLEAETYWKLAGRESK